MVRIHIPFLSKCISYLLCLITLKVTLDREILERFGTLFIEDSERPGQNLCKNALKSWGEGGELS